MNTTTNQIRAWRGSRSQEWAARELGTSLRNYQRWESGKTQPRGLYRAKLEAALSGKKQSEGGAQ